MYIHLQLINTGLLLYVQCTWIIYLDKRGNCKIINNDKPFWNHRRSILCEGRKCCTLGRFVDLHICGASINTFSFLPFKFMYILQSSLQWQGRTGDTFKHLLAGCPCIQSFVKRLIGIYYKITRVIVHALYHSHFQQECFMTVRFWLLLFG